MRKEFICLSTSIAKGWLGGPKQLSPSTRDELALKILPLALFFFCAIFVGCGFSVKGDETASGDTGGSVKPVGGTNVNDAGQGNVAAVNGNKTSSATNTAMRQPGPALAPGSRGLAVVPMRGCSFAQYYAGVNVGDDHLSVLLDSGSTTVAVAAKSCTACGVASTYDASTGTNLGGRARASYIDGTGWSGMLYSDNVSLGPLNSPLTPTTPLKFAAITAVVDNNKLNPPRKFFSPSADCGDGNLIAFEGIFGLGPDSLLVSGTTGFLTSLVAGKGLAYDAFAMQLCDVGGNLMLGGYATNTVSEQPFFVPMLAPDNKLTHYSMNISGLSVGGISIGLNSSQATTVTVDSGSNCFVVPTATYESIYKALYADRKMNEYFDVELLQTGYCVLPAQSADRKTLDAVLPKLKFMLPQSGGTRATLEMDATRSYLTPVNDDAGRTLYCNVVFDLEGDEQVILGNPLMRQYVTVFDRANRQIGFARETGCPSNTP